VLDKGTRQKPEGGGGFAAQGTEGEAKQSRNEIEGEENRGHQFLGGKGCKKKGGESRKPLKNFREVERRFGRIRVSKKLWRNR